MASIRPIYRRTALVLAVILFLDAAWPVTAMALTGGPSQPEVESFEPIGTTQMVNPFTGDFTYNIPLMTVPGPNGGYPINLAYHAGIGMEQEASWVGLGWNINVGTINRMMRGLPDDFKGDNVRKALSMKQSTTVAFDVNRGIDKKIEFLGADLIPTVTAQMFYNNFTGVGYQISANLAPQKMDGTGSHFAPGLTLSYNSANGLGVDPSVSYLAVRHKKGAMFDLGFGFNSREGFTGMRFQTSKAKQTTVAVGGTKISPKQYQTDYMKYYSRSSSNSGAGASVASGTYVPMTNIERSGINLSVGIYGGKVGDKLDFSKKFPAAASITTQYMTENSRDGIDFPGFGYLYSGYAYSGGRRDRNMMDYIREKDVPVNKRTPYLPIPIITNDIYSITGQGIGGVFRPYRNESGLLQDNQVTNTFVGGNFSLDLGAGSGVKLGSDIGVNISTSYTGSWEDNTFSNALVNKYQYSYHKRNASGNAVHTPDFEPVYFKATGEMAVSEQDYTTEFNDESPVAFTVKRKFGGRSFVPEVINDMVGDNGYSQVGTTGVYRKREPRAQHYAYRTNEMIFTLANYTRRQKHIYTLDKYPSATPSSDVEGEQITYDRIANTRHHIGEISVTNPDGTRYVYGLPAYNKKQVEVVFSLPNTAYPQAAFSSAAPKTVPFSAGSDDAKFNDNGSDQYFSKTEIPPYAYSYLLTAVYSPDYVDLTGDGPSADDLGYYVKFNYSPHYKSVRTNPVVDYKWRIPYDQAQYNGGNLSDINDDKGSYVYGEKEVYYLNSIETKTHIAEFHMTPIDGSLYDRNDGYGASNQVSGSPVTNSTNDGRKQLSLKYITLYSKSDRSTPLKQVNFQYNYELCPNVNNNISSGSGKLTLKKVWFTYLGNAKGALNPYEFDYGVTSFNRGYDINAMDRWGNYQQDGIAGRYNAENPYTRQAADYDGNGIIQPGVDDALRNNVAGLWCIKKITLPSGGEINVNYESDDYAYVHNKPAMEMVRIVGTSPVGSTTTSNRLGKDDLRIYFELDRPIGINDPDRQQKLEAYTQGIDLVYFKTFQRLKRYPDDLLSQSVSGDANDYVSGYAKVDRTVGFGFGNAVGNNYTTGYITLQSEPRSDLLNTGKVHPFRKAGWQYLRLQRADLFDTQDQNANLISDLVFSHFKAIANELPRLLNYYAFCELHNFNDQLKLSGADARPSFLRLNAPTKKKYGGGHRVSKISINDKWSTMVAGEADQDYGQEFTYEMPDGTSSGVAEYEPLIGGDEIALRLPKRYDSDRLLSNDDALYLETPFCENLYPGPSVGYRRVVTRSLKRISTIDPEIGEINPQSNGGYTVQEFFTAKEFPIKPEITARQHKPYKVGLFIPFVGWQTFNNHGYAQGYSIVLNDMHGKLKSTATYSGQADINNPNTQPTARVEYRYKTREAYNPNGDNYLDGHVTVLDNEGSTRQAEIGKTIEFYTEARQHSNNSLSTGIRPDVEIKSAAFPDLNFFSNYAEAYFRSAVSVKIIQQNAVLEETIAYEEGSTNRTKNLMFDAETGQPLLTQTLNDYNQPLYGYSIPARWAYEGMSGKWENWGFHLFPVACTNHQINIGDPARYFTKGDEVSLVLRSPIYTGFVQSTTPYWVHNVVDLPGTAGDYITLMTEDGVITGAASLTFATTAGYELILTNSARTNQLSVMNGGIATLGTNPVTQRGTSFLNNLSMTAATTFPVAFTYTDCKTGTVANVSMAYTSNQKLTFTKTGCGAAEVTFDKAFTPADPLTSMQLVRRGSTIVALKAGALYTQGRLLDPTNCFTECLDNVLQASAVKFADDQWSYYYQDIGNPSYRTSSMSASATLSSAATLNPYRFGQRGIWKGFETYAYQAKRKQTAAGGDLLKTDVAKDGVFEKFSLFNWQAASNSDWTKANTITLYSPYGYELEEKNALDIYSSALYGYDNSVMTAMAQNCRYFELVADGFEDYSGATGYVATTPARGHIKFAPLASASVLLNNATAHTGKRSLRISGAANAQARFTLAANSWASANANTTVFTPSPNKKYSFSVWVKPENGAAPQVTINSTVFTVPAGQSPVEGWYRIEGDFTTPAATSSAINITLSVNGTLATAAANFDDFRIQPFQSSMMTYVYDRQTLWLLAELDERNYATFYNYDEEGALVQVKKETERGVMTIQTSRNNMKRN